MRKDRKSLYYINRVKPTTEILLHFITGLFAFLCVIPFVFAIIISFTSQQSIYEKGYSFFPQALTLDAYKYVFQNSDQVFTSFGISIIVTVAGTIVSIILTSLYAYVLFRKDYAYRKFFTYFAFFPMLFSGGLVPFYIVVTRIFDLKDTIWALMIPGLINTFNIIVLRTYFTISIPPALLDSADIDGCGELRKLCSIIFPISLPGIATIGLFSSLAYWNDWFPGLLFITDQNLLPLQNLLILLERRIEYIFSHSNDLSASQLEALLKDSPRDSSRMVFVVLIVVPIAFAYPFFQRYFVQGLTIGSVKG